MQNAADQSAVKVMWKRWQPKEFRVFWHNYYIKWKEEYVYAGDKAKDWEPPLQVMRVHILVMVFKFVSILRSECMCFLITYIFRAE